MAEASIRAQIIEVLHEVIPGAAADTLDPEVSFRDQIEMDSVDFLDFVQALEKRLGIRIPDTEYPRLSSLEGCERVVRARRLTAAH